MESIVLLLAFYDNEKIHETMPWGERVFLINVFGKKKKIPADGDKQHLVLKVKDIW